MKKPFVLNLPFEGNKKDVTSYSKLKIKYAVTHQQKVGDCIMPREWGNDFLSSWLNQVNEDA